MAPSNCIGKKLEEFFTQVEPGQAKVKNEHQCKFCPQKYSHQTTRMAKHILEECEVVPEDRKSDLLQFMQKKGKAGPLSGKKKTSYQENSTDSNVLRQNLSCNNIEETAQTGDAQVMKKRKFADIPFFDTMTQRDQNTASKLLVKAIYVSGSPLQLVENIHWKNLFKFLRPAWTLPSRHEVSNKMLDNEYSAVKKIIDLKISSATSVTVQCDTWTNIRGEAVMNFLISTPEPVFYVSLSIGTDRENAQFIHDAIKNVIDEVDVRKTLSVVTDNVSANVRAWELLSETYKSDNLSFYGCVGHIGQLLIMPVYHQLMQL